MSKAEVHVLDHGPDPVDTHRLVLTLARALQDGQDLGPRGHHIRAGGLALKQLNQEMLRVAETLPLDSAQRVQLNRMSHAIERLTVAASTY